MKFRSLFALLLAVAILAAVPARAQDRHDQPSDDYLYDVVRRRLTSDPVVKGGRLEVEVSKGVVTLRGKVDLQKQKDRAVKLVKKVKGVRGVENHLEVANEGGR